MAYIWLLGGMAKWSYQSMNRLEKCREVGARWVACCEAIRERPAGEVSGGRRALGGLL